MTQATKKLREVQDLLDHEILRAQKTAQGIEGARKELDAVFTALQAMQAEEHRLRCEIQVLLDHGYTFAGLMESMRKLLAVMHSMDGHLREKAIPRIGDEVLKYEPVIREAVANWDAALKAGRSDG